MDADKDTRQARQATLALAWCAPALVLGALRKAPPTAVQLLGWLALDARAHRTAYDAAAMARWLGVSRATLLRLENLLRDRGLIVIERRTAWHRVVRLPWVSPGVGRVQ